MGGRAKIRASVVNALLNSKGPRRSWHSVKRAVSGGARHVTFFYRVDDPYSHLLAQVLPAFVDQHGLEVELVPVSEAGPGAHPEPRLLAEHAARDAALLADEYRLSFPSQWTVPSADRVRRAHAVLLKSRDPKVQLEVAVELGEALWRDNAEELAATVSEHGAISGAEVAPALEANYLRLERAGHYQSGMLHYGGEWYWGIDRLWHLEQRLHDEGSEPNVAPVSQPPAARELIGDLSARAGRRPTLEVFFSFRSPYSYIAMPQLAALQEELTFDLKLRPVLPMVMRGLPVPRSKQLYIVQDAKREAERLGIPFGRICDPVGKGVEQCIPVCLLAERKGLGLQFAERTFRAIWSEAVDVSVVSELTAVAADVGLNESEVQQALEDEGWRARAEQNREELFQMGLWGVPSFRLGEFVTWGQDRVPVLADRIRALTGARR